METSIGACMNDVKLFDRVLDRLGLPVRPPVDLDALRDIYAAWCLSVPFDNIAKLIALHSDTDTPLPGIDAHEFFERWLDHGAGGTCWPTSNALCELLLHLGFDARRVAGSMRDTGYVGHGSVKVRIASQDWLVDSSLLTDIPLPLTNDIFIATESVFGVEVEPADGTHVIWADLPPYPTMIPCRLLVDPTDHDFYVERYEASRIRSPFNQRLYARRNRVGERIVLDGNTWHVKSAGGLETRILDRSELLACLINEFGISRTLVSQANTSGALDASFEPPPSPPIPYLTREQPSRRQRPSIYGPTADELWGSG